MRLEKFASPGDIDFEELSAAVYAELIDGADPVQLVRFLTTRVELPEEEASGLVGQLNARLQDTMHQVAEQIEERVKPAEILRELESAGWSREQADAFVARTRAELDAFSTSAEGLDQLLAKARRRMWHGLAWAAGGAVFTVITYAGANPDGGQYVMAYGPVLFGLGLLGDAAIRWCRYKYRRSRTADI